jgi:methyl-accepting chemotaxis protein WspA
MKQLTLWQRLNFTMAMLILLLAIVGSLAFWMERARAGAEQKMAALDRATTRIALEIARHNESMRAFLLHAGDPEKKTLRDSVDTLETELRQAPAELADPADALRRCVRVDVGRFDEQLIQLADSPGGAALALYASGFPAIQNQVVRLAGEIAKQSQTAAKSHSEGAQTISVAALAGIVLALLLALLLGSFQSRSVAAPMQELILALEPMQRGDFTQRLTIERSDEFGVISGGLNKLADELSGLVSQVQRSGIQVGSTATEIAATAREQQTTANEIAATTAEIGATSKQISATSRELVKTMNEVSHVSGETADLAGAGQNAIANMEHTMHAIMAASGSVSSKLAVLSEKTANINTVVTTVTKVADQTNLLSLNAAIEAEKAGEYGLGFAVVAMEIRRLADQTAVATYDIEKMVKEMQSAVSAGVMGMDKFSEEVRSGVDEVRKVGAQLAKIIHQVQTLSPRFQTVNEGMNAQATGAQQISETLTQLNEAAQLTAESMRQSNLAIEQLNEAAHGLQNAVARFKLK